MSGDEWGGGQGGTQGILGRAAATDVIWAGSYFRPCFEPLSFSLPGIIISLPSPFLGGLVLALVPGPDPSSR